MEHSNSPLPPLGESQPIDDSPLRVLLVEDDPAAAALVRELLALAATAPVALTHVTRLGTALAHLADGENDAVLLDLSLPDAQDLQALTMLRAAAPRVPVVILSANADEELAREGVQAGAQDYLVKGRVTPEDLRRALRYAIERQRGQEHLTYLAFHDALTGLPNRALLEDRFGQALAHARRTGSHLALLFLDLDGFKAVNDRQGHDVGDALLQEVAARLAGCTRGSDTIARLAGDEFVALLPGADEMAATAVAAKVLAVVGVPYHLPGLAAIALTASVGISVYPDDAVEASALLRRADAAMYGAKRRGKNGYLFAGDGASLGTASEAGA